jgi:two-component sensor histidine kinase
MEYIEGTSSDVDLKINEIETCTHTRARALTHSHTHMLTHTNIRTSNFTRMCQRVQKSVSNFIRCLRKSLL